MLRIKELFVELAHFFILNLRASQFGIFLIALLLLTSVVEIPFLSRYDFIFLSAVLFQIGALYFKFERPKEFFVIFLFHIVATGMELFKTNPAIGSWAYPEIDSTFFVLATVPLFAGFLYSAVGSYISRAMVFMNLSYTNFPRYVHLWALSALIYVNFFTHHFIYDFRYFILLYVIFIFWKVKVRFTVYKVQRSMPFLLTAFLTAFFIWIAENIGTITNAWLYPSQSIAWHVVSLGKMGSWFLLLILSFALVSIVYRERLQISGK